jgi:hypothetical protein
MEWDADVEYARVVQMKTAQVKKLRRSMKSYLWGDGIVLVGYLAVVSTPRHFDYVEK